jgi:long-chain acyl-CoA synthetase
VQDFLQDSAQQFPEKVALICSGARLTYSQIETSANGLAQYLLRRGLRPGD